MNKRIGYGVRVPTLSFKDLIEITRIIGIKGGEDNSLEKLSGILNNSISSSAFNKKIAALKNFGVIEVKDSTYRLTELGKSITHPYDFKEQAEAIAGVFFNNGSLRKIWEHYYGKILPGREGLSSGVKELLDLPDELKYSWTDYFLAALKYAGMAEERGGKIRVIKIEDISSEIIPVSDSNRNHTEHEEAGNTEELIKKLREHSWSILNIITASNNKKSVFAVPEGLNPDDIKALKILIKGIDVQLDGLL